jgi:hypothetical protein
MISVKIFSNILNKIVVLKQNMIVFFQALFYKIIYFLLILIRYGSITILSWLLFSSVYKEKREVFFFIDNINNKQNKDLLENIENNNEKNSVYLKSLFFSWREVFAHKTRSISLLKQYKYKLINNEIQIISYKRDAKFLFQNFYYDREGILIEKISTEEINNSTLCNVIGNNKNFFFIYQIVKDLKLGEKFDLLFTGMRWSIIIYKNDKKIIIKLPISIDNTTLEKINYLKYNAVKENIQIIDLRFANKIYFVEQKPE